ncbi:MAG: hypothetical protein HYY53_00235 [candidate division NC10 bacterium]|nr:hypothetical protein [candidate division NC10 bacterium]MBI4413253.1 hypothetical protein [candidate division NC10 bacterium]
MAITWADISTLTLFFSLAGILLGNTLSYLRRRDAEEVRRNRQDACTRHEWTRGEPVGMICRLCGKTPG